MKEKRITIEIDANGKMTADAEGFSGDACLRDLDKLLDGLTAGAATIERKPEAHTAQISAKKTITVGRKS
jgi:hypothetical protein